MEPVRGEGGREHGDFDDQRPFAALGPNPLLFPILNAPAEAFATDTTTDAGADALVEAAEKGGEGLWAGSSLALVAGFQAKSGARALWVGGVDMFSDELANLELEKCVFTAYMRL